MARRGNAHYVRPDCHGLRCVSDARQRSGGVEKYSSIASRQAPEHGSTASSCRPDSRMSAAILSAQLMQTPARSIPQPRNSVLDTHTRRPIALSESLFAAEGQILDIDFFA